MIDAKNSLSVALTEPLVFLRTSDPTGRLQVDPHDPPTLVRGILTLNVIKPIEISSIEVELVGVLTIAYSDGVGPYRTEHPERRKIYSSTVTVFNARKLRPASIGPGFTTDNSAGVGAESYARPTMSRPPSTSARARSERPNNYSSLPFDDPTPPYTPVAQSAVQSIQPPSRTPSAVISLSDPITHSGASSASHNSFNRENDIHSDEVTHTSPSLEGDTAREHSQAVFPVSPPLDAPQQTQLRLRDSSCGPSNTATSRSRLRLSLGTVLGAVAELASRSPSRHRHLAEYECEEERGRTRDRILRQHQNVDATFQIGEGSEENSHTSHQTGHSEHREHHFLGLGRIFGLENDHHKETDRAQKHEEGWKEFKPGTYSYPVSFLFPPHLPPTFSVPHGSLDYYIKGVAHRPGTFTSKLSCKAPVLVVAVGDGEDAGTGDLGPVSVERHWEGRLAYSFELSSRLLLLGSQRHDEADIDPLILTETEARTRSEARYGTAVLDLTLMPLEKIKIWKLSVLVQQCIRYGRGKLLRDNDLRLVKLLELTDSCSPDDMNPLDEDQVHKDKHKSKDEPVQIPLLPTPVSPHRSPLLRYVPPSSDPSNLMGPGPYPLSIVVALPGCNGDPLSSCNVDNNGLYFTMKQRSSSIRVEHTLKVVMRVERIENAETHDHGDKSTRKLFDILVQAPITVLSCRCDPEFQTLPRYSQTVESEVQDHVSCPCRPWNARSTERERAAGREPCSQLQRLPPGFGPSVPEGVATRTTSSSGSSVDGQQCRSGHPPPSPPPPLSPSNWEHEPQHQQQRQPPPHQHHSRSSSYSASAITTASHSVHNAAPHVGGHASHVHPQTPPRVLTTPHSSRPPSPLARYERLVAGLESEAGEAPPSYDSLVTLDGV